MTTLAATSSTSSMATAYGNQRKIDRTSNGVLWAWPRTYGADTTAGTAYYSTDNGATWTASATSNILNGSASSLTSFTPDLSVFIDADDYAHTVLKDISNGYIYYRRGTPNAARTAYAWSTATQVTTATNYDVPDLVAFRDPAGSGGWVAQIVISQANASTGYSTMYYVKAAITAAGAVAFVPLQATSNSYPNAVGTFPSIDFQHTGDGKTPVANPALFVGWSAGATGTGKGIRFKKATYSAGAWTWGTEQEIDNTRYVSSTADWLNVLFDGTRVVFTGWAYNALILHDRDAADTTTTTRTLFTNASAATDLMLSGSATYDRAGNVWFVGRDNANAGAGSNVKTRRWVRSTAALDAADVIDGTSASYPYASVRRGTSGSRLDYVYTDGTASPYAVMYGGVVLNTAPNAPTGLSTAAVLDRTVTQRLPWTFSDPNTGDTQSKADLQWRTNASGTTGAWQAVTVTAPTAYWDAPAATFPAGGIEWQVRTYDAQGVVGPWSASAFFTASTAPATPTITAPVSGATIPTSAVTLVLSEPNLDSFDWRVLGDANGSPDLTKVLNVGGTVADPSARSVTVTGLANGTTVHLQVRVAYQGLKSTWADSRNPVSYTPPPAPTVTVVGNDATGALLVTTTNPAPTGTQPAVSAVEVWVDDGDGLERRKADLAPNTTWAYLLPVSGRDYTGHVRLTAVAVNGTTASSS